MRVDFDTVIGEDETPVQIQAVVVTWRDEGTYRDGPLMATVEGLEAFYEDGRRVDDTTYNDHYPYWSETAIERAIG